jgi:hypothetical protein
MKPLITLNPITTWSALRAAFRELLTHPSLGETAEWFASYLEEDIHDEALVGCWSAIESDFRHDEREGRSSCSITLRDLDCDIEEVVSALVSYNNNGWNFAPGGRPPLLNFNDTMVRVGAVIGLEIEYPVEDDDSSKV